MKFLYLYEIVCINVIKIKSIIYSRKSACSVSKVKNEKKVVKNNLKQITQMDLVCKRKKLKNM